jgi:hypothetical protein
MTSALDGLDTRAKAAAIISGRKLDMLEQAGMMVVERRKLEALERVAEEAKEIANLPPDFEDPRWYCWTISNEDMEPLIKAVKELEAMERE